MSNLMPHGFNSYTYKFTQMKFVNGDKSIFQADKIVLPINCTGEHWIFMGVKMRERGMFLFDSQGGDDQHGLIFDTFNKFLKDHAIRTTGCLLEEICGGTEDWTRHYVKCPTQGNGTDCGVFACVNMLCFTFDLPFLMSQEISDSMRIKIGVCAMNDTL